MTPEQRPKSNDGRSESDGRFGTVSREVLVVNSDEREPTESGPERPPAVELDAPMSAVADRLLATTERRITLRNDGELVGVVSARDVVRAVGRRVIAVDVSVADVYCDDVDTVFAGTPLQAAVRQIATASGSSAIVLDEAGAAVGLLTEDDVVDAARFTQGEPHSEADPGVGGPIPILCVELPTVPVSEISTDDVPTVPADSTVADAAQLMISRDTEQVAVQRGDQIVGVVGDRDILHALADRRRDD